MINSTDRITQTNYFLLIKNTLFHNIESSEAGGVFCVNNVDIQITNCHIASCYSPRAAAIYAESSILSIFYCCFSNLSVRYSGNNNEGIVIDVSGTPVITEYCSIYKCAESISGGADGTFMVRNGMYLLSYENFTECNGKDGSITVARIETVYGPVIKYCSISHSTNYDLIENNVNLFMCNFVDCNVACFGFQYVNFTQCYFMNVNQKSDHGNVYYFDCIGEYPKDTVDGESFELPFVHNRICYEQTASKCTTSQNLKLKFWIANIFLNVKNS